jgi:hypothetical protein
MAMKHSAAAEPTTVSLIKAGEPAAQASAEVLNLSARMMEQSTDQVARLFGTAPSVDQATRQSNRMDALQECGSVAVNGYQALSHECLGWIQNQIQANVSASVQLMRCRSPQEFAAAHNQFIGASVALALKTNSRLAGILKECADSAVDNIAELAEPDKNGRHRAA